MLSGRGSLCGVDIDPETHSSRRLRAFVRLERHGGTPPPFPGQTSRRASLFPLCVRSPRRQQQKVLSVAGRESQTRLLLCMSVVAATLYSLKPRASNSVHHPVGLRVFVCTTNSASCLGPMAPYRVSSTCHLNNTWFPSATSTSTRMHSFSQLFLTLLSCLFFRSLIFPFFLSSFSITIYINRIRLAKTSG